MYKEQLLLVALVLHLWQGGDDDLAPHHHLLVRPKQEVPALLLPQLAFPLL